MRFIHLSLALGLALGAAGSTRATSESDGDMAVAYRQSAFKLIYWNFSKMGAMVRGAAPFDATDFAQRASRVAALAEQLEEGFPKGSETGGVTEAKPEIWTHWDDFTAKLDDLKRESAALREVTASRDEDAMKAQFQKVRQTCGACHDEYKAD
jgi:cytochrome c556